MFYNNIFGSFLYYLYLISFIYGCSSIIKPSVGETIANLSASKLSFNDSDNGLMQGKQSLFLEDKSIGNNDKIAHLDACIEKEYESISQSIQNIISAFFTKIIMLNPYNEAIKNNKMNHVTNNEKFIYQTNELLPFDQKKDFASTIYAETFRHKSDLKPHTSTYTKEENYLFDTLGKKCDHKNSLSNSLTTHTGEKPYKCTFERCRKEFNQHSSLITHLRTHTLRRYNCTFKGCKKEFNQRCDLEKHIRIHTGEKPYTCKVCGKKFKQQSNLITHLTTHTGEKPYKCTFERCRKEFNQKNNLNTHIRIHTMAST